ncbi:MAG: TetR/AcrR family transcriptional regulator [Eggerthellaceae bacterium]
MPAIVDKESVREDVLRAFRACIERKPISKITLRDVAEEAGMSHAKLLYYFDSRDDLVHEYMRWSRGYLIDRYEGWFDKHPRTDYDSDLDYFNSFLDFVAHGDTRDSQLNSIIQTYVLAHYDPAAKQLLDDEYDAWLNTLKRCLRKVYGTERDPRQAEALMVVVSGMFICRYNGSLSGDLDGCAMEQIAAITNLAE